MLDAMRTYPQLIGLNYRVLWDLYRESDRIASVSVNIT
jgi:hypothetical protein